MCFSNDARILEVLIQFSVTEIPNVFGIAPFSHRVDCFGVNGETYDCLSPNGRDETITIEK